MNNIIYFDGNPRRKAKFNLEAFIVKCRPLLHVYQKVTSWDESRWNLEGVISKRPGMPKVVSINFLCYDSAFKPSKRCMRTPFIDFAKAYFLYSQSMRNISDLGYRISALRAIEFALVSSRRIADPTLIDPSILNLVESHIQRAFRVSSAYHIGRELEYIANFVSKKSISEIPFDWKSSCPKEKDLNRVGEEADRRRARNLPTATALDALPKCFVAAERPVDVIVSSIFAILVFTPSRIGEVLQLSSDCEVFGQRKKTNSYGLRWHSLKGGPPMVKEITPSAQEIVKSAILKIKKATESARKIAAFYENHQSGIFNPATNRAFRNRATISLNEATELCGENISRSLNEYLKKNNIASQLSAQTPLPFELFESFIRAQLPSSFPYISGTKQKLSNSLFTIQKNLFAINGKPSDIMIQEISMSMLDRQFGKETQQSASIFSRFGMTEMDGSPIMINSHQLRHLMNTILQDGAASQIDIAKWSGRKDIGQNRCYDNRSREDFLRLIVDLYPEDPRLGSHFKELASKSPVAFQEFKAMNFPTAHVTEIGFCLHDFSSQPCLIHRDCINCNELVCLKGDREATAHIKELKILSKSLLQDAVEQAENGAFGALRWVQQHEIAFERYSAYLRELENPANPDGSLIRITNPNAHSAIGRGLISSAVTSTHPHKSTNSQKLLQR